LKKGRAGTLTHDHKRNWTTMLFAALNVLDDKVIGRNMQRHRHQEFIRFRNANEAEVARRQARACDPRQLRRSQALQCVSMAPAPRTLQGGQFASVTQQSINAKKKRKCKASISIHTGQRCTAHKAQL
jgi:hypothetical protein